MRRLTILTCSAFLAWHIYHTYDLSNLFINPKQMYYLKYDELVIGVTPVILLFFLIVLIFSSLSKGRTAPASKPNRIMWSYGFGSTLALIVGLGFYVNPHGLFPWEFFPFANSRTYISTAVRTQKLNLFDRLDTSPDLIILGSSRAHLISSSYVYQRTGLSTFNMAIHGGLPLDFLTLGQYIFSKQNPSPSVLVVELIMPTRTGSLNTPLPVKLIPYLEYPDQVKTIHNAFLDLVSLRSISDAFYQITYERLFSNTPPMVFKGNGTGVQTPITREVYEARLEEQSTNFKVLRLCLSEENKKQLEKLAQIAMQHQTAIFFYRSPLNAAYLERPDAILSQLNICKDEFKTYMEDLKIKYPNIFFSDLSQYEPISSLRWGGYYDIQHLKPVAAQLVVDAIIPDLLLASNWANEERLEQRSHPEQFP